MTQVLSRLAGLNGMRLVVDHRGDLELAGASASADILHVTNSHARLLVAPAASGVHVVRNPFSVVVSAYFSHLRTHPVGAPGEEWHELVQQRERLSALSKSEGLHATIRFLLDPAFYPATPGPLLAMRDWPYGDPRFVTLRMEDFVKAPVTRLMEALQRSGVGAADWVRAPDEEFAFERISGGRRIGEADVTSHFRSGDPQDWKSHLDAGHLSKIRDHCRQVLEWHYPELA